MVSTKWLNPRPYFGHIPARYRMMVYAGHVSPILCWKFQIWIPLNLLSHCRLTLFCWGGRRRIAMIRYQFNGTYTHANIYNRHWKLQKPLWIFHPNWLGHPASLALNFMVLHCTWLFISSQEPCFTIFYASPSSRVSFSSGPRPLAYSPLRAPSIRSEICWRAWS